MDKRKASCHAHGNLTHRPNGFPGMSPYPLGVGRQLPNLAPKSTTINSKSAPPVVENEPEPPLLHKRQRFEHDLQTPSQLSLDTYARPETNPPQQLQPMYFMNDTWSHENILGKDTSFGGLNALSVAEGSEPQSQTPGTIFNPFSDLQNISPAVAILSSDIPSTFQPPTVTMFAESSELPTTQAFMGCPRCHTMLRNLREGIITITCGPSGARAIEELWKSYFRLEDHWNEGHAPGGRAI